MDANQQNEVTSLNSLISNFQALQSECAAVIAAFSGQTPAVPAVLADVQALSAQIVAMEPCITVLQKDIALLNEFEGS